MFQLLCHVLQSLFVCLFTFKLKPLSLKVSFCKLACSSMELAFENKPTPRTLQLKESMCIFPFVLLAFVLFFKAENKLQFRKVLLYNAQ